MLPRYSSGTYLVLGVNNNAITICTFRFRCFIFYNEGHLSDLVYGWGRPALESCNGTQKMP